MSINNLYQNELIGKWTLLSTKEIAEDVEIILDGHSTSLLLDILNTNRLTKDNQRLFAKELWADKRVESVITKYQSPWTQNGKKFSISSNPRPSAHFKMELSGLTIDSQGISYVVNIILKNVIVSFLNLQPIDDKDKLCYTNVELMVVSDNNTITILADNDD